MRRMTLAVLPMLLCLLCACSSKEKTIQAPMEFRTNLLKAGACTFSLHATEEFDDRVYDFSLACTCQTDGTTEATVSAPESISGISARTDGKTGELICEGTVLSFGVNPDARLAPLAVPSTLVNAWAGGYIASSGKDGAEECTVYELGYGDDTLKVYTWSSAGGVPLRVELALNGEVLCRGDLSDFQFTGGNNEAAETNLGGRVPGQSGS